MGSYRPDRWVVLEFVTPSETVQKVFGGWYGGYEGSDTWRLNSGIVATRRTSEWFEFDGSSGSTYYCDPINYGMSAYMYSVLQAWVKQLEKHGLVDIVVVPFEDITE